MSVTVKYFFNSPKGLQELSADFREWLGADLQPYADDPDDLYCRFLGMEFSLTEHEFENDCDADFENYRYYIDIRTAMPDADFRPMQLMVMPMLAYALHRRLGLTGMLVYELQRVLARYEQRIENGLPVLHDVVSDEVVTFPRHLAVLMAKVPDVCGPAPEMAIIEFLRQEGHSVTTA